MSQRLFDISHDIKLLNFDSGLGFLIKIPYKNKGLNFLKKLEAWLSSSYISIKFITCTSLSEYEWLVFIDSLDSKPIKTYKNIKTIISSALG